MLFDQRVRFSDNHSLASSNNKALTVGRCMVGVLVDVLLLSVKRLGLHASRRTACLSVAILPGICFSASLDTLFFNPFEGVRIFSRRCR